MKLERLLVLAFEGAMRKGTPQERVFLKDVIDSERVSLKYSEKARYSGMLNELEVCQQEGEE